MVQRIPQGNLMHLFCILSSACWGNVASAKESRMVTPEAAVSVVLDAAAVPVEQMVRFIYRK